MKLIVCENYEEVSACGAKIVADMIKEKPDCVLGLPTGSTPVGMYKDLAKMNKEGEVDFSKVTTFNLDEYYPILKTNDQSYRYFMDDNLFHHINIPYESTHVLNGEAKDPDAECKNYEEMIKNAGGIDLQVLGIGRNGHVGFNEPGTAIDSRTHMVELTDNTREANARFFASKDDVPTHSLTMGIGTILDAKKIILLASGPEKKAAIASLLAEEADMSTPSNCLREHDDVTIICSKDALDK